MDTTKINVSLLLGIVSFLVLFWVANPLYAEAECNPKNCTSVDTAVDIRPGEMDYLREGGRMCMTNHHVQPPAPRYSQGSYGRGYSQGSYRSYGQGSYGYGQGSYGSYDECSGSLVGCSEYSQGAYFSCPSGQSVYYNGGVPSCCPNQYYSVVDTNGSAKGGNVGQCNVPSEPTPSNTPPDSPDSCTVNGVTVSHGGTYTFYTTGNVAYNQSCSDYAVQLTCNDGTFTGSSGTYSNCVSDTAPQVSTITIDAIPPLIRYGEASTIEWNGGNAEACTVTGAQLNTTGITGSELVAGVTGESTYTLRCTLGPNSRSASTTLKVLPEVEET